MQCDEPVETNNLVLSQLASQQERHLGLHLGALQRKARGRESFRHFYSKLGHIGHLLVSALTELGSLLLLLRVIFLVHTLLDKRMSVQLLGHLDTQLQVLADEVFKLLGPHLLPLSIHLHLVIVTDNFFNGFPIQHHEL